MFKLDFSLTTAEERNEYIKTLNLATLTPSQLELCANYVLYGKDKSGKSEVDRKHIYINTKYNSYARRRPESLDALMENPNFDEGILSRNKHSKIVNPTIDRVKDANIPTMKEMWAGIDRLQYILDVNTGKAPPDNDVKKLNENQIYRLRHGLIDIRRGQYYLKDIFKPTMLWCGNKVDYIPMPQELTVPWNAPNSKFGFAPLGLIGDVGPAYLVFKNVREIDYCPDLYNRKADFIIDFRNSEHIYKLIGCYEDLCCGSDDPDNMERKIADTLDWYIARAALRPQHYVIIDMKKRHCGNKAIAARLKEEFGLTHTENYISTIYTQQICPEIARAAEIHYKEFLERDSNNWKKCSVCGRVKLKNDSMFIRKCSSRDGFNSKCKACEKTERAWRRIRKLLSTTNTTNTTGGRDLGGII